MEERLKSIEKSIDRNCVAIENLKNNHLKHLKDDVGDLKIGMVEVKTDLKWLKKFFFIVAGASIGSLIAGVINLI